MQYQTVYDLIETIKLSDKSQHQKMTGLALLKQTMDDAIDLSIQLAKTADIYVKTEEAYNNHLNGANEKFNKILDAIEAEEIQGKIEDLSSSFEQIVEMGKQFGVSTSLENLDLTDNIDVMLEGKQLVDEMSYNGQLRYIMFHDKNNIRTKEEAMQIIKERQERRDIEISRKNNTALEEKAEIRDFEHKLERTENEKYKMNAKIEKEIQQLEL